MNRKYLYAYYSPLETFLALIAEEPNICFHAAVTLQITFDSNAQSTDIKITFSSIIPMIQTFFIFSLQGSGYN